jgi:hypothetical protein
LTLVILLLVESGRRKWAILHVEVLIGAQVPVGVTVSVRDRSFRRSKRLRGRQIMAAGPGTGVFKYLSLPPACCIIGSCRHVDASCSVLDAARADRKLSLRAKSVSADYNRS